MPRLGRAPYIALWVLITIGQVGALWSYGLDGIRMGVAAFFVGFVLKALIAAPRSVDLGRPADDAVLALVPLVNLGLWRTLWAPTPTAAARQAAMQSQGHVSALRSVRRACVGAALAGAVLLPVTLVLGLLKAAAEDAIEAWTLALTPETAAVWAGGLVVAMVITGAWTLLQYRNRDIVGPLTWLPSLFLLPSLLLWGGLTLSQGPYAKAMGGLLAALSLAAFELLFLSFAGAAMYLLFTSVAVTHHRNGRVDLRAALALYRKRLLAVLPAHAGLTQLVFVGMQVIIPGVHYAVQFAFVDAVGVMRPNEPIFEMAKRYGRVYRRDIFKVLFLGWVGGVATQIGFITVIQGLRAPHTPEFLLNGQFDYATALKTSAMALLLPGGNAPFDVLAHGLGYAAFLFVMGVSSMALVHMLADRLKAEGTDQA